MSSQATPTLSIKGIGASPGVAVGRAFLLDRKKVRTPKLRLGESEVEPELKRMRTAIELSDHQLSEIKERLSQGEGHDHALILEAHRLMLHDPMFVDEVNKLIERDHINAEWAVRRVARKIKHIFDNIPDEYFRERRADLDFVADRVVRNLMGQAVDVEVEIPAITTDGWRVHLYGNMEFLEEIPSLLTHGAEGIGLYRTEFLFLDREHPPTEEEHFRTYRTVLEAVGGRPVTIRTLDLGGDKVPALRRNEREPNPALGLRAIRWCLQNRDVFRAQLRGLLRASAFGNLRIMFPLISGLAELREARSELERCRSDLSRAGVPMGGRFPVGIMMETPSAAWIADRLVHEADVFSVGTNDLIQYSLAVDRHNRDVAYLYRPLHLSLLRSIQNIVTAAKGANVPISMCGEMAGDPVYTLVLLAFGFNELSMTAGQIPMVKRIIRRASRADAVAVLESAMRLTTAEEIERFIRTEIGRLLSDPEISEAG